MPREIFAWARQHGGDLSKSHFLMGSDEHGRRFHGPVTRMTDRRLVCSLLSRDSPRVGQTLHDAQVFLGRDSTYRGAIVLKGLMEIGPDLLAEFELIDAAWKPQAPEDLVIAPLARLSQTSRALERVPVGFKAAVADVVAVLQETRASLEDVAWAMANASEEHRSEWGRRAHREITERVLPELSAVFRRWEEEAERAIAGRETEHRCYAQRQLLPHLLASPFIDLARRKPLGIPGDYATLGQVLGDPLQGPSLFAQALNAWVLTSRAGDAYRFRVSLLADLLEREATRARAGGRGLRVLSVGCGSAPEVRRFLAGGAAREDDEFTLVDLSEETLRHCSEELASWGRRIGLSPRFRFVRLDAQEIAQWPARTRRALCDEPFDFIYCAGLFDYLSDRTCKRLLSALAGLLAPGGLIAASNFTPANPLRHFMSHLLDWNLRHRTRREFEGVIPESLMKDAIIQASPDEVELYALSRLG